MSFARFSTDDLSGKIRGYSGGGRFTDDPLETFGGAGVVEIPHMQNLAPLHLRERFRASRRRKFLTVAPVVYEASMKYFGWEMYAHGA